MPSWRYLRTEFRPLMKLAVPLVVGELGWMTMGLVDTIMVGRVSAEAMGAVSLGSVVYYTFAVFAMGLLYGLDTLISQAYGAGRREDCDRWVMAGLWLCVPMTPLLMAAVWTLLPWIEWFGTHPAVAGEAAKYLYAISWSSGPLLLYTALRRYLQSMDLVRPIMFALVSANIINAAAVWVLVFGYFGMPAMGAEGAGWATTISRVYMAAALAVAVVITQGAFWKRAARTRWNDFVRMMGLGFPAAVQMLMEVGVFALTAALVSRLAPASLAAHHVAISAATYSYMLALGLNAAAAVRVGQAVGRGDRDGAAAAGWAAIVLGVAGMGLAGVIFLLFPRAIGRLFTNDTAVIDAAVALLALAALWQLFDGAQGVATGALRGAGDTQTPAIAHGIGYWLVGLPVGYWLTFYAGWGAAGMWTGMCVALVGIGITLLIAWRRRIGAAALLESVEEPA
jgi:MATE family multidrug resistance protein